MANSEQQPLLIAPDQLQVRSTQLGRSLRRLAGLQAQKEAVLPELNKPATGLSLKELVQQGQSRERVKVTLAGIPESKGLLESWQAKVNNAIETTELYPEVEKLAARGSLYPEELVSGRAEYQRSIDAVATIFPTRETRQAQSVKAATPAEQTPATGIPKTPKAPAEIFPINPHRLGVLETLLSKTDAEAAALIDLASFGKTRAGRPFTGQNAHRSLTHTVGLLITHEKQGTLDERGAAVLRKIREFDQNEGTKAFAKKIKEVVVAKSAKQDRGAGAATAEKEVKGSHDLKKSEDVEPGNVELTYSNGILAFGDKTIQVPESQISPLRVLLETPTQKGKELSQKAYGQNRKAGREVFNHLKRLNAKLRQLTGVDTDFIDIKGDQRQEKEYTLKGGLKIKFEGAQKAAEEAKGVAQVSGVTGETAARPTVSTEQVPTAPAPKAGKLSQDEEYVPLIDRASFYIAPDKKIYTSAAAEILNGLEELQEKKPEGVTLRELRNLLDLKGRSDSGMFGGTLKGLQKRSGEHGIFIDQVELSIGEEGVTIPGIRLRKEEPSEAPVARTTTQLPKGKAPIAKPGPSLESLRRAASAAPVPSSGEATLATRTVKTASGSIEVVVYPKETAVAIPELPTPETNEFSDLYRYQAYSFIGRAGMLLSVLDGTDETFPWLRERVVTLVFDNEVAKPGMALDTLVYNTRKKAQEAGLDLNIEVFSSKELSPITKEPWPTLMWLKKGKISQLEGGVVAGSSVAEVGTPVPDVVAEAQAAEGPVEIQVPTVEQAGQSLGEEGMAATGSISFTSEVTGVEPEVGAELNIGNIGPAHLGAINQVLVGLSSEELQQSGTLLKPHEQASLTFGRDVLSAMTPEEQARVREEALQFAEAIVDPARREEMLMQIIEVVQDASLQTELLSTAAYLTPQSEGSSMLKLFQPAVGSAK